jgi:AraC-like DNA-binding protein
MGDRDKEVARGPAGLVQKRAISRALEYVQDNLAGNLSLQELAGAAGYSPHHFARLFKEATDLPPHRYVVSVIDNHSRCILASAVTRTQDLASYLSVLYAALERYGSFEALVTDEGENIGELSARSPGSTLGDTLSTVALVDGTTELYIRQEEYHQQFAADVPAEQTALMATSQRPLRDVALNEGSGAPAWKSIPSWFVFGELDKNIPVEVHCFMAERAQTREAVEIEGASHAFALSHADEVADVILRAITAVK